MDDFFHFDLLKSVQTELLMRRAARHDLGFAALEKQLMLADQHHGSIAAICLAMADFVAGMPERIGESVVLSEPAMHELRRACTEQASRLRGRAQEAERDKARAGRSVPSVEVSLKRLTLGERSRLVRGSKPK